jgi:cytoskeletal protein CcmA (bactofilin family)
MFSKAKPKKSDKPGASVAPSILSADITVTGDVASEGEIQIDGKVKGDVRCCMLTVGVTGCLSGQVFADNALIRGKVEGQIRAHNVTLTRTARVIGDILHESLMIEPGAYIEGRCERLDAVAAKTDKRLNLVVSKTASPTG